jgi:uncharacterized protein YheU (UPF0270 family)
MTEQETREVRMYGTTEAALRESIERSMTFKVSGPAMIVAGMLSDVQEIMAYGPHDSDTLANIQEDQRQQLNRAKWVLFEYMSEERV